MSATASNTTTTLAAMRVEMRLDRSPPDYEPGAPLRLEVTAPELIAVARGVELSIVWYTTGKGEEDLAVHDFRRLTGDDLAPDRLSDGPLVLETTLPSSPHSYAGRVVKVCWAARARFFLPGNRQLVREAPLRLGGAEPRPVGADEAGKDKQ